MKEAKDLSWFQNVLAPQLKGYEIQYRFFEKGDFGSLDQVEFNSKEMGGEIDFWSSGCLGMHLVNYEKGTELLNFFIEPDQDTRKAKAFEELQKFLTG